jgi:hypothetical protein
MRFIVRGSARAAWFALRTQRESSAISTWPSGSVPSAGHGMTVGNRDPSRDSPDSRDISQTIDLPPARPIRRSQQKRHYERSGNDSQCKRPACAETEGARPAPTPSQPAPASDSWPSLDPHAAQHHATHGKTFAIQQEAARQILGTIHTGFHGILPRWDISGHG